MDGWLDGWMDGWIDNWYVGIKDRFMNVKNEFLIYK